MSLSAGTLLGPYEITQLLNSGGMGEIYRARDTRLERDVAVKVLVAPCCDREQLGQFQQEAKAAGALNHPNIVAVYDIGMHAGVSYVVSELIDGPTLRDLLQSGPLPLDRAVGYALQIARGLAAAHEKGIVHSDLKPGNLMLTRDERVKIVDFGAAKINLPPPVAARAAEVPTAQQSLPGAPIGTLAYMSPEQLRNEAIDPRSDIFSFGAILHEMVTGVRLFERTSSAETISAILRDVPAPLPGAPPEIESIVHQCLETRREARFQSAHDLALALEFSARSAEPHESRAPNGIPAAEARERTIALLPFTNLNSDPDAEYFSDGLTEELIHELTRLRGLQVVAWNSAAQLRGQDIKTIGEQLKVDTVLLGSVRRAGGRVRIAARLVETATGYYLWSETYDRQVQDIFAIQEEIARSIVGTLTSALHRWSPAIGKRQTGSFEAYTHYLKGRHFANRRSPEGLRRAIECFEQAIAADERSALAHAGLADMYCLLADYGLMHPRDAIPRSRSAVLKALELDPRSAEAHCSYGLILSLYDWQWEEAEAFYLRSLELNPGYATAHHWYAIDYLGTLGRFDQAHREIGVACRLDPLSMIIQEGPGYLSIISRRYDDAIQVFRDLLQRAPEFYKLYTSMGRAHIQKGDYPEAIALLQKGRSLAGDVPNILGALGQAYALANQPAEARRLLQQLAAMGSEKYVPSTCYALIHAGLGETDKALEWLERGCEDHELPLTSLKVHPAYDSLRGHPRFASLLRAMNLET